MENETVAELGNKAEQRVERMRNRFNQTNENLQDISKKVQENAADSLENAMDWIRDNPGASVGIALIVGAGVGALMTTLWSKD